MKATKTWRDMLSESLKDPNFRKAWVKANAELAELDAIIAAQPGAQPTQIDADARVGATQSASQSAGACLENNLMQNDPSSGRAFARCAEALGKRVQISSSE